MSDQQTTVPPQTRSADIGELVKALAAAKLKFEPLHFNRENPAFKRDGKASRYADLGACYASAEKHLNANGLATIAVITTAQGSLTVCTQLHHTSGQWISDRVTLPVQNPTPHGYASTATYAKRISYQAILGLYGDEDDDGNEASGVTPQAAYNQARQQAAERKPAPKPSAPADVPDANVKVPPALSGEFRTGVIWQFGRLKGKDLAEFTPKELSSSFDYLLEQSADPAKARFKEKNDELAAKVMNEIERREGKK